MDVLALAGPWIAAASVLAFALAVVDKRRARAGRGRVPERALLLAALAGGSPGLALGMVVARHKTRKASFLARFALVLALQAFALWILLGGRAA